MKGTHLIVEMRDCSKINMEGRVLTDIMVSAAEVAGMTVLHYYHYNFSPQGCTAFVLLSESHISIHTYPEDNYISLDVYCCGRVDPKIVVNRMVDELGCNNYEVLKVDRG